jgi:threonyl-tRNA synthetase
LNNGDIRAYKALKRDDDFMKILMLHSNFFEYNPLRKEINLAEEAEKKKVRLEEIAVLFVTIEKEDTVVVAKKAIKEIAASIKNLELNRILIYPYSHLSHDLAPPVTALKILKEMEAYSKEKGIETFNAPFGWNKQFTISIKGHPLAEQFRVVTSDELVEKKEEKISKAIKAEEKLVSYWHILQPKGKMTELKDFNFNNNKNLQKFANYETSKIRASRLMPPHVLLMKRLEIADYEPGSDPGHIRWYPKGRLIKSLIEQVVTTKLIEYGAMEVETPIMYDFNHPSLADYLNRFPARQYLLKSEDKELFLRFAACFGQFLMIHDTQFSYKHMPIKIYELTRYSFRREKSGEVVGLRRLRAFTMPDCHAFCTDLEQAKKEFLLRFNLCISVLKEIGLSKDDYEVAIRFTKAFYEKNRKFIVTLSKIFDKPVLIEMWKEPFFYFRLKWDFNFVDNQDKAAALSTDQIDFENSKRYKITFTNNKGEKQHPLILHCSPSGAIERCVYALLEKAYKDQQRGKPPMLPLWLSPTQVRIIPMNIKFLEKCQDLVNTFKSQKIRADIDDRLFTLQRSVREAEMEWIPYIIVIGKKEIDSNLLPVRKRKSRKICKMTPKELIKEICTDTSDKPFKPLPLPQLLSERPQFFG